MTGAQTFVEHESSATIAPARLKSLQKLGVLCGFAAGAWLGAAEAPTKLVSIGVSPLVISFMMVLGVFLARWSVPALLQGMSQVREDVRQAPHLMLWGILAGCLWAVANTLTIFAIRNIGLSIAFPLWNSNSLLGIFWGFVLFNELRNASRLRWLGVLGGAVLMFAGGVLLASASSVQTHGQAMLGIAGALGAGVLWGTMYIPYRKAYLTGMSPLSFVTFFAIGELGMVTVLAVVYCGGVRSLWDQLLLSRGVLFWLVLGGVMWVIGDIFQQYAAKYIGISRGIPLSNTNQLWGLIWGIMVFAELRGASRAIHFEVIAGSAMMALGAGAVALSSATEKEHASWKDAAQRESQRYNVDEDYVFSRMAGHTNSPTKRSWFDWLLAGVSTVVIIAFALMAEIPKAEPHWGAMAALLVAMFVLLAISGVALWRATKFN
jgi:drug/metabolite transporter (DMT)-like permease